MSPISIALGFIALIACCQLIWTRYRRHLSSIPGPFVASFSNLWKVAAVYCEDMPGWNIGVHEKYGPVVRIGPSHVSFSSPEAFQTIHASRQAFAKTNFYEVGAPPYHGELLENLFSLRDTQRHTTLKRTIGGFYTKTAVKDFESKIDTCVGLFMSKLGEHVGSEALELDMSMWLHLFAYDCLSEINVSERLGFLEEGKDVGGKIASADQIFYLVGLLTQAPVLHLLYNFLRDLKPAEEAEPIFRFTLDKIRSREKASQTQKDMLDKLLGLHQEQPDRLSIRDVTAAVYINLTAGHDVLAITLRAIWYYLAINRSILNKLRTEIFELGHDLSSPAVPWEKVSKLPYLNAVIQEALRIHPNTGTIIERKAPSEGVVIDGYSIPGGTTVGVNAWVLHRNKDIFGADVDKFRPERWLEASEEKRLEMSRYLFSFGAGAHTCIGKNIAIMMITKLMVEFFQRYDMALAHPERKWRVHGSWVTKQTEMNMVVRSL